jgi:hypothetical protein
MPSNEDHSIIRAYTGNPNDETELNRGRIQLAWQDANRSGLRIISYDRSNDDNEEDVVTHEWTFQGDGSLELPGDIRSESAINIDINLTDSTLRRWRFGEDGDLTFPDNTTQTTAFPGFPDLVVVDETAPETGILWFNTNEARMYVKYNEQWVDASPVIIPLPQTDLDVDGDLTIGGDILPSVPNGGNLGSLDKPFRSLYVSENTIFIGNTSISVDVNGQITTPNGFAANQLIVDEFIDLGLGATLAANEGVNTPNSVFLSAPINGSAVLSSNESTRETQSSIGVQADLAFISVHNAEGDLSGWIFDETGTLTLPEGGDIVDSNGNSVLGGGNNPTFENAVVSNTLTVGSTELTSAVGAETVISSAWGPSDGVWYNTGGDNRVLFFRSSTTEELNTALAALVPGDVFKATTKVNEEFYPGTVVQEVTFTVVLVDPGTEFEPVWVITVTSSVSINADAELDGTIGITISGAPVLNVNTSVTADNFIGNLTLPAGGNIVDSTGVNQTAQREEGSWTVTAGTNTYSFTVPSDGTYVMWVKGNIPNGIITWNATLSVSNSNVPAIGTQYAWNYTGGGTPISLTSIPDQIKGVAGTISTDATYAGTTSNRFDFGISNTSGESQTVYYGYTRI